jgi:hypothetical protein
LVLIFVGCSHLAYVGDDPRTYVNSEAPSSIVVNTVSGERVSVSEPVIEGDSLIGRTGMRSDSNRVSVSLADIQGVYVNAIDGSRTALAVASSIAALYLIYLFGLGSADT